MSRALGTNPQQNVGHQRLQCVQKKAGRQFRIGRFHLVQFVTYSS